MDASLGEAAELMPKPHTIAMDSARLLSGKNKVLILARLFAKKKMRNIIYDPHFHSFPTHTRSQSLILLLLLLLALYLQAHENVLIAGNL
jgi:hypothetical protein